MAEVSKSHRVGLVVPVGGALVGLVGLSGCSVSKADWDPLVVATGGVFAGSGDIEDSALRTCQRANGDAILVERFELERFQVRVDQVHLPFLQIRTDVEVRVRFKELPQLAAAPGTRQEHQGKSERFGENRCAKARRYDP